MTWQRLPLAFVLHSPLHIGFLPNQPGTVVARTRCYVPGKNLWGATVANLTPRLYPTLSPGAFRNVGHVIHDAVTFSYFYLSDGSKLFTPDYGEHGLWWGGSPDRAFRSNYLGAYVSTQIEEAGGAAHGALHEIEFLRYQKGTSRGGTEPVLLAGAIWVQDDAVIEGKPFLLRDQSIYLDDNYIFAELTLGGERNYGFGRVLRIPVPDALRVAIDKLWSQSNPQDAFGVGHGPLLGHIPYRGDYLFKGDLEIIAGREYPEQDVAPVYQRPGVHTRVESKYWFGPGTRLISSSIGSVPSACVDSWGRLSWVDQDATSGC